MSFYLTKNADSFVKEMLFYNDFFFLDRQAEAGVRGEERWAEQGQDYRPVEEHPSQGQNCRPQARCCHTQGDDLKVTLYLFLSASYLERLLNEV